MVFLTNDKKEFNIQKDQLAGLHTQAAQLQKQNLELQTDNCSQLEFLETFDAAKMKLENQLAQNNSNYDEKMQRIKQQH